MKWVVEKSFADYDMESSKNFFVILFSVKFLLLIYDEERKKSACLEEENI